jgi:hypothetical protein
MHSQAEKTELSPVSSNDDRSQKTRHMDEGKVDQTCVGVALASTSSSTSRDNVKSPSKLHTTRLQLVTIATSLALIAVVIAFVQTTYTAEIRTRQGAKLDRLQKLGASSMLAVLRLSQGVLSLLTTLALDSVFLILQWNKMDNFQGSSFITFLSISPSTNFLGLVSILRSGSARASTKLWALSRLLLPTIVWISGLILFFNTSLVTVYDTAFVYPVTAGVGPFNGSLVQPFREFLHNLRPDYPYATIPYNYLASAYTLVLNPLFATVADPRSCATPPCTSYLLSGGLTTVIPWVPSGYDQYPLVRVKNAPSIQADFSGPLADSQSFADADCDLFGQHNVMIGIRLCLKTSPLDPAMLMAGMFVCPEGIENGACSLHRPLPNITTQVSFYSLQTSFVTSRLNYTITNYLDSTDPLPILDLELPAYRDALNWLLNYTDANLPPPSSIAQSFWSSQMLLGDPSTWGILSQNFQSILLFPFWLFNANNWGNVEMQENVTISTLPAEFYTEASLVKPYTKLRVDSIMFALFLTLHALVLVFICGVVVWIWWRRQPARKPSSFPLIDVVFSADIFGGEVPKRPLDMDDLSVIKQVRDLKVNTF